MKTAVSLSLFSALIQTDALCVYGRVQLHLRLKIEKLSNTDVTE